jgi:hypothetical protein
MIDEPLRTLVISSIAGLCLAAAILVFFGKASVTAASSATASAKKPPAGGVAFAEAEVNKRRDLIQRRLAKLQRLLGRSETEVEVRENV